MSRSPPLPFRMHWGVHIDQRPVDSEADAPKVHHLLHRRTGAQWLARGALERAVDGDPPFEPVGIHHRLPHALDRRVDLRLDVHDAHSRWETLTAAGAGVGRSLSRRGGPIVIGPGRVDRYRAAKRLDCLPLPERMLDRGVERVQPNPEQACGAVITGQQVLGKAFHQGPDQGVVLARHQRRDATGDRCHRQTVEPDRRAGRRACARGSGRSARRR